MAKNSVQDWDGEVASNNSDVGGINIAENCPPSNINDAIREIMRQVRNWQSGGDSSDWNMTGEVTFENNVTFNDTITLAGSTGTNGQVLTSLGADNPPVWSTMTLFSKGMIMMWSGLANTIPSGWHLCDGTEGTPDLRDRFVIGAGVTHEVGDTGGSKDAVAVAHTHTGSTNSSGSHSHKILANVGVTDTGGFGANDQVARTSVGGLGNQDYTLCKTTTGATVGNSSTEGAHTHSVTVNSAGISGVDQNLPPYMALCYIMKL